MSGSRLPGLATCRERWSAVLLVIVCAQAWPVAAQQPTEAATAARPNILFIYTDDQAPTAVRHLDDGGQFRTPNLDGLFRDGVTLQNSFVTTPVCSPSRAGLMTGRYSSELQILDWLQPRQEADRGLDPEQWPTWPRYLQQAGYVTGLIGKWHLGMQDRYHPVQHGFDEFSGFRAGGAAVANPVLEIRGRETTSPGLTTDVLTGLAIDFLRRHRRESFFLAVHYRAPHAPWLPVRDEDWAPFSDLEPELPHPEVPHLQENRVRRMLREYMASVAGIDRNVGNLREELVRLGLERNTIVIFTSDHGYHLGHHGLWYKGNAQWQLDPLPRQRWDGIGSRQRPNLYDQALRVPTAVYWPGVTEIGSTLDHTVTNLDWFPTLLEMAGVPFPNDVVVHGRSIVPLLRGEARGWDQSLYAEYSMRHGAQVDMRCWRTPSWKLVVDFRHPGREELYHLAVDPEERVNLIRSRRPDAARMRESLRERLHGRMRAIGDPAASLEEGIGDTPARDRG